jgi:putative endonuclease
MPIPRSPKNPCVYILANKRDRVLYVGVTSDVADRVNLHKQDLIEGFTKRYGVHLLVYYGMHHTMPDAIRREKQLKKWNRAWKVRLIEQLNPEWRDLWTETGEVLMFGPGGREFPSEQADESAITWRGSPPSRG